MGCALKVCPSLVLTGGVVMAEKSQLLVCDYSPAGWLKFLHIIIKFSMHSLKKYDDVHVRLSVRHTHAPTNADGV